MKSAKHYLGELLAVIHGDGGHYQGIHGNEQATKDALEIIYTLRNQKRRVKKKARRK